MIKRLAFVLGAALIIGGCYSSPSDLIGERGVEIQAFDSLVVIRDNIYAVYPNGRSARVCEIRLRTDLSQPCHSAWTLKMERTRSGNYILQFSRDDAGSRTHFFGIWMRSNQTMMKNNRPCIVWMGDGFVGASAPVIADRVIEGVSLSTKFPQLYAALRQVSVERVIDRRQLLEIAGIYERFLGGIGYDNEGLSQPTLCIGPNASLTDSAIAIAGDNRHLPAFEAPAADF